MKITPNWTSNTFLNPTSFTTEISPFPSIPVSPKLETPFSTSKWEISMHKNFLKIKKTLKSRSKLWEKWLEISNKPSNSLKAKKTSKIFLKKSSDTEAKPNSTPSNYLPKKPPKSHMETEKPNPNSNSSISKKPPNTYKLKMMKNNNLNNPNNLYPNKIKTNKEF